MHGYVTIRCTKRARLTKVVQCRTQSKSICRLVATSQGCKIVKRTTPVCQRKVFSFGKICPERHCVILIKVKMRIDYGRQHTKCVRTIKLPRTSFYEHVHNMVVCEYERCSQTDHIWALGLGLGLGVLKGNKIYTKKL